MAVQPIPGGHHTLIPHLTVSDGNKAIDFYQAAFGAEVGDVARGPDGKVLHADLKIGDSRIFLNDQFGPPTDPAAGVTIHIWSLNVDAAWKQAVDAGAQITMPLRDAF